MTIDQATQRLTGRRALVTGAGSGIGRVCALRLAREGAVVAVVDLRSSLASETSDAITCEGGSAIVVEADVSSEASVALAVMRSVQELGGLDTIVTAAGILQSAATHEMDLSLWEAMLAVNLTGTFLPIKHGVPHLLDSGGGAIVTIGSVASVVAGGWASCYDAVQGRRPPIHPGGRSGVRRSRHQSQLRLPRRGHDEPACAQRGVARRTGGALRIARTGSDESTRRSGRDRGRGRVRAPTTRRS